MKILFLDIDGVLNPQNFRVAAVDKWEHNPQHNSRDQFGQLFDPRCVAWLRYIIRQTGCKIVISSTWRMSGLSIIKELWKFRKLPGIVVDVTPDCVQLQDFGAQQYLSAERGYEIKQWLDLNFHTGDAYCIVDDTADMLPDQNFVKTDPKTGIDRAVSFRIINILNKK